MSEWWTYSLHDFLLFSPRTYFRLVELYNADVWPAQALGWLANAAIALLAIHAWRARRGAARRVQDAGASPSFPQTTLRTEAVVLVALAAAWAATGWAWLWQRYATINWAASYMASGFAVEAAMLLALGARFFTATRRGDESIVRAAYPRAPAGKVSWTEPSDPAPKGSGIHRRPSIADVLGFLLLIVSLAYPSIALLSGRSLRSVEVFAVMPDPTVIATLGFVVLVASRGRWMLLFIPLLWCAVGGATLWAMQSPEALLLPIAGVVAIVAASGKGRRMPQRTAR